MRIVYVTSSFPFGRTEGFLAPELEELRRQGHHARVVPIQPGGPVLHATHRTLDDTEATGVASPRVIAAALVQIASAPLRCARAALQVTRSRSAFVLLKNLAVLPKGLWLATVATRFRADHIHVHWASTSATVGLIASTVSGIPWSFTAHRWDISEDNLLREKVGSARFVRAISARGAREIVDRLGGHADGVVVLHMGVELPAAVGARPPRDPLTVLMAANLVEVKGHRHALEAVALLRARGLRVVLELAGAGPLRPVLEASAVALGIADAVHFLGALPHAEIVAGLQARRWAAAALSSVALADGAQEGIPVFLMEAMAAGVPVVATRTGGIPELLEGGAGLLVPERDASAIADALAQLATDDGVWDRLACAGRCRIRSAFHVETIVRALVSRMRGEGDPDVPCASA